MDLNSAKEIVKNSNRHVFSVRFSDNTRKRMRLFVSSRDILCVFAKRSRKYGYPLSENDVSTWEAIETMYSEANNPIIVRKFLQTCVKYLSVSGLWPEFLNAFTLVLKQDDEYIKHLLSLGYSAQRKYLNETIGATLPFDSLLGSALRGVVSINYNAWDKDVIREDARQAIKEGRDYKHRWRKNYDNSVMFEKGKDNKMRGWYSTEYKGCANGHYYYALDESHAVFGESD